MNTTKPGLSPITISILLACYPGLALQAAEAASPWDCRQEAGGKWVCAGAEPAMPAAMPAPAATPAPPGPSTPSATGAAPARERPAPAREPAPEPAARPSAGGRDEGAAAPAVARRTPPPLRPASTAVATADAGPGGRSPWALCAVSSAPGTFRPGSAASTSDLPIEVSADRVRSTQDGEDRLEGEVRLTQGDRHLQASQVTVWRAENRFEAEGGVRYSEPGFAVAAERARLRLDERTGELEQASYELPGLHASGRAERAELRSGDVVVLKEATYTTCDPGRPDWELSAGEVKLDPATGRGEARQVKVDFKDVPIFYWPYLSFPIDDKRHTGFLVPTFGTSEATGLDLSVPYYINLAPSYDATLTPRLMSRRGLQVQGEFRYLLEGQGGQVTAEVLPHDNEFGDHRELLSYQHQGVFAPGWSTDVDLNYVSDEQYFRDLGNGINLTSTTHLDRRADLRYDSTYWSVLGRAQSFQTVDETLGPDERPYDRMPQLLFRGALPEIAGTLRTSLRAEYTRFDHESLVTGQRVDLEPGLSLPLAGAAWFLTPSAKYRYTGYSLDDPDGVYPDSTTRALPVLSLDGGLFFERPLAWDGGDYTQTLEPRLYYLYVPNENQDDIPVFDSAALDFSFEQLFRDNRFSGRDRVGDANQLTLALTSRVLDNADGRERLRAGLGSVFYFSDREVGLETGAPAEDSGTSDLVGEVDYRLSDAWYARGGLQWNTDENDMRRGTLQFHYQPDNRRILNLAYRLRKDIDETLEQTDASLLWPLNPNWSVVGRWNYSIEDRRTLDAFAGFEYGSCCWALRLVARHYVNDLDEESNNALYLQLELKGLTRVGNSISNLLEHGILGYSVNPDDPTTW